MTACYGAEARAYGQLLLFAILACLTLTRALRSGTWRQWLLYGASQFGLLWSQPTGIYLTFVLGVCGVLGALGGPGPWRDRWTVVFRFTIVNLLAGMLFLQMMAPNIAQSMAWTDVHQQSHRVGLDTVARSMSTAR